MEYLVINISASIMILLTFIVRKVAKNYLPHIVFSFLWIIIALRLLIPLSVETPYSYFNLRVSIEKTLNETTILPTEYSLSSIKQNLEEIVAKEENLLHFFWLTGFCIISIHFTLLYISMRKDIKAAQPFPEIAWIKQLIIEQQIHRTISLKQTQDLNSPAVWGLWKSNILFPRDFNFTDKECIKYMILHECGHIKYCHSFCKVISMLLVSLYWYNPFVWLLYLYLDRDMEISCDCYALKQLKYNDRAEYAKTLLVAINMERRISVFYYNYKKNL